MNAPNRPRPSESEAIEARAAAWIAQRDDGLTPEESAAFERWCAESPAHAAAVARLDGVWTALHELRDFRPAAFAHPDPDLLAPARRRRILRFPVAGALAALAAVLVLGVLLLRSGKPNGTSVTDASSATYVTAAAGFQRVALADGSIVELNANTIVRVHYTAAERCATLLKGEAHFTVAANARRPFWVEADTIAVRAVGTAFDVRREASAVAVLVTAGRVRVDRNSMPLELGGGRTVLAAGWRATISTASGSPQVEEVERHALRDALSWQSSRLAFVDTPLGEVVEEFNRHNEIQLVLGDADVASLPIGGSFGAENVESFVRLLSSNGDVRVERPTPNRIVLRRGR